jgi:hypothetical protein
LRQEDNFMPDLSDPLGPPKIVTGVDYMHALAALGYNVENMSSPLPVMSKIAQSATSLVDNQYNQALQWQKDKAGIQEAVARANNIDSQTDFANQALDLRLKDLDLQNKQRQQGLDFASDAHPIQQKLLENQGKSSDLAIQQAQRSVDDQNEALGLVSQATSELPNPDDPDYAEKRDEWRLKYNRLLTNPATKARMEGEYQAMDGIYQSRILTQQTNAKRKEFGDLQTGGFIPSVINPDAAMRSPDSDTYLTRGRMLQSRQQVESIASQLPDGDPYKDRLQTILNEADTHTKSDTGVQDIMAGKSSVFDTNGRLTGTSLGAAQQAEARARALSTAGKPETQLEIGLGQPSQKGEYPSKLVFKGVTPEVGEQLAERYGLKPPQPPQPPGAPDARFLSNIQDPQIRSIGERLQRKEITYDQAIKEMQGVKQPAPIRQPGMPAGATEGTIEAPSTTQTGKAGTEDRPAAAAYADIPTGANTSIATLQPDFADKMLAWEDGMRQAGYNPQIVQAGRNPAYQAKLHADYVAGRGPRATTPEASFHSYGRAFDWVNVGQDGTLEWNNDAAYKYGQQLAAKYGLRGLGEADNDHLEDASFASYRDLPKNEYGRVATRGGTRTGTESSTAFNANLPRPKTVEEAQALPPGTHFIDPEGNRRVRG